MNMVIKAPVTNCRGNNSVVALAFLLIMNFIFVDIGLIPMLA
jgi:hypothetical protein